VVESGWGYKSYMLTSLYITGYKNIEVISLDDLKRINVLVGPNGSGKSSILQSLALTMNQIPLVAQQPREDLSVHIKENDFAISITEDNVTNSFMYKDGNIVPQDGKKKFYEKRYNLQYFDCNQTDPVSNIYGQGTADIHSQPNIRILDSAKPLLNQILPKHLFPNKNVKLLFDHDNYLQYVTVDTKQVPFISLSSGELQLFKLLNNILSTALTFVEQNKEIIFIIEEPETSLHPSLQKEILPILSELVSFLKKQHSLEVCLFITTHSLSLISSVDENQTDSTIFFIEDGRLNTDAKKIPQKRNFIMGGLLGYVPKDLDYPENFCLTEEASLNTLLNALKERGFVKNWQFISTQTITQIPTKEEALSQLSNFDLILNCNIFYASTYFVIVDEFKAIQDTKLISTLNIIKQRLNKAGISRFIRLAKEDLESHYQDKNIFSDLYTTFELEKVKLPRENYNNLGKLKSELASKAATKILDSQNPRETFQELFEEKLDFLLL